MISFQPAHGGAVDRFADIRAFWMQRTVAYRLLQHHLKIVAPVGALRVQTHLRGYVGLCRERFAISLQHLAERLGKRSEGSKPLLRRKLRTCERWVRLGLLGRFSPARTPCNCF